METYFVNGYKAEIAHTGGDYCYGIYDVTISKDNKIVYRNHKYYYRYISFGAIYLEVIHRILNDNNL